MVLARLTATVSKADAIAMQEGEARVEEHAAIARRRDLRLSIRRNQLTRLVQIADFAAHAHPELQGKFILPPRGMPNKPFLLAARSLLAAATPQKELFISLGLGDTLLDELSQLLDQMDGSTTAAHSSRTGHIAARTDLPNLMNECGRDIAVLGTYYRATQPKNSEVLAAWNSARKVPGPFAHHQVEEPVPAPTPAPAPVQVQGSV